MHKTITKLWKIQSRMLSIILYLCIFLAVITMLFPDCSRSNQASAEVLDSQELRLNKYQGGNVDRDRGYNSDSAREYEVQSDSDLDSTLVRKNSHRRGLLHSRRGTDSSHKRVKVMLNQAVQLLRSKSDLQRYIRTELPPRTQKAKSRGIVIPSGGPMLLTNAYVNIRVLREVHNCTLPIHVVYNGPHEMDQPTRTFFEVRSAFR